MVLRSLPRRINVYIVLLEVELYCSKTDRPRGRCQSGRIGLMAALRARE